MRGGCGVAHARITTDHLTDCALFEEDKRKPTVTKARDHDDLPTAIARLRDQQLRDQVTQAARGWTVDYYPPPTANKHQATSHPDPRCGDHHRPPAAE